MMTWLLLCAAMAAQVQIEPPPVVGVQTVVSVVDSAGQGRPGETVRVVHRPGLDGERELAIGITDGFGRVAWTPDQAGVATVRAGASITPVRISWVGLPTGTLAVAGVTLALAVFSMMFGFRGGRWKGKTT